ncbi:TPA: DUF2575 domain-containing protein [Klebsiella pneumoniae]|nr:DUF2575 domain-containing protein [Klebsiella pneumoniae]
MPRCNCWLTLTVVQGILGRFSLF